METLIIVANSANACLYSSKDRLNRKPLALITKLSHPQSRKKISELISDRPGHYNTPSTTRGAYEDHANPKRQEADIFAREIAMILDMRCKNRKYEGIHLIMPTHFRGLLERHLTSTVSDKIIHIIPKDLTLYTERRIRAAIH